MKYITIAVFAAIVFMHHNAHGASPKMFKGTTASEVSAYKASVTQVEKDIGGIAATVKVALDKTTAADKKVVTQGAGFTTKIKGMKAKVQAFLDKQKKKKKK
ncbi:MAG TPA: hypothetical protein QGF02_02165 [Candidatus Babeliales bacterium]|nr:hypothetical protein [Candidatus Babeliales bacterium]